MAREESDREDLLREATALVDRAEFQCEGWDEVVVCGFRRQGTLSLWIGPDEVYQFDSHQALRRVYWQAKLLKAERGRLVELTRKRTPRQTLLVRRELSESEEAEHLQRLARRVEQLRTVMRQGRYRLRGEVSASGQSVTERLAQWLDRFPLPPSVAATPRVR